MDKLKRCGTESHGAFSPVGVRKHGNVTKEHKSHKRPNVVVCGRAHVAQQMHFMFVCAARTHFGKSRDLWHVGVPGEQAGFASFSLDRFYFPHEYITRAWWG